MKPLSRRYQVMPGWWYCRECPARENGGVSPARAHAVVTGHEVRHVQAKVIVRSIPASPPHEHTQQESENHD